MLEAIITSSCSPDVHPLIVNAIVKTESNYNPFAIGVNRGTRLAKQPTSFGEAVQTAKRLLASGANIDMGLGQINSANLNWLGLSVEQAFTPCANLQALQYVYLQCYAKAGIDGLGDRMQRALSCYNTGNTTKGFSNGYVNKVTKNYNHFVKASYPIALPSNPPNLPVSNQAYPAQNQQIHENAHRTLLEPHQDLLATKVPNDDLNASVSVSVRPNDDNLNPPTISEIIQTDSMPIKVYNRWDIFRDF